MNLKALFTCLFITTSILTLSQTPITTLDSILNTIQKDYPEISVSISILNKENVHHYNIGTLSRKDTLQVNEHTLFEIASITKCVTGNLIAQAINEQKLKASDYIDLYLPEGLKLNKHLKNKITIADLASHQSGLPDIDFPALIAANPQQPVNGISKQTIIDLLYSTTELKDHGKYRYSTVSFILLGQILEFIYNTPYDLILQEKIIEPLQLERTLTKKFKVKNTATGYNPKGGEQELFNWNITAPAGLIKSTSNDMVLYIKAILSINNSIGLAATKTEQVFYKDSNIDIGLGINIINDSGTTFYAKTGDTMGQSSILAYCRTKKWGIIILINERNSKLRNGIFNAIYESL